MSVEREEPKSKEMISSAMNYMLDCLGYDKHNILERRYFAYKRSSALTDSKKRILGNSDIEEILVGSIRDGIGMDYTSDIDILQINHGVICVENVKDVSDDKLVAFKLDYTNTPSGYARLILINKGNKESRNEQRCLSSDKFMTTYDYDVKSTGFIQDNSRYLPREGPSCPVIPGETYLERFVSFCTGNDLPKQKVDLVPAFPCKGKSFLKSWSQAIKGYKWPPRKLKDIILTLPMHVVPVGHKSSRNKGNEWRVSFTMAEHELLLAFNNTQMKLLVLLKIIAKHYLEVISNSMTSYVMKHVIFWIVATHPEDEFIPENLYKLTEISLNFLKSAINAGKLSHFIVTKRNLFEETITGKQKTELVEQINLLLENGQGVIRRLLWDNNENNAAKVFHEKLRTMEIAFAANKLRNFTFALVSYEELSDLITYAFNASHFRLIVQELFDWRNLYILFKVMVQRRGDELLKLNLMDVEIVELLYEYERKLNYEVVITTLVNIRKCCQLNVDKKQEEEEKKFARSHSLYNSKDGYLVAENLNIAALLIILVILISNSVFYALSVPFSFVQFMNCVAFILLVCCFSIIIRCEQERYRMLQRVLKATGTYDIRTILPFLRR